MVHVRGIGLDSGPAHILPFAIFPLGLLPRLVSLAVSRSEGRSVFRSRIALLQIEMKLFLRAAEETFELPPRPTLLPCYIVLPHVLQKYRKQYNAC